MNIDWNSMKRWSWRLLKVIVGLVIGGGLLYWMKFAPLPVVSHTVERGTIVAEVMGTGTLEARVQMTVSPKISGRMVDVLVDQGARVAAGDLLVLLDDAELQQQVKIAQANVDAASAGIVRLLTDKRRAEAVYEQTRKSDERTQVLLKQNAISPEEADKSVGALAVAEAGVARAEAAIAEAQKELVAAEKTLEYHRARLHDTKVVAPFDGLIVKRRREPGDVVVPGSSILTLISTDELWISAWIDETQMARLRTDQPARVIFRSQADRSYPGTVIRLGREADRETREFIVDVRVLELPENWAVGQRAETYIETERSADSIVLPVRWLVDRGDALGVFLNIDGQAVWRPLKIGMRSREAVEVLEGLEVGDVVVTSKDAMTALKDGRRVASP